MNTCPKCGHRRQAVENHVHPDVCPSCGIAYSKWLARQQAHAGHNTGDTEPGCDAVDDQTPETFWPRLAATLTAIPEPVDPTAFWPRVALYVAILAWACWLVSHGIDWEIIGGSFIHNVNLAFHEFGHVLFSPFGDFMMLLGGSLFQVILPLLLLGVFVVQQDNFSASLMLCWCGQNLIDVAPYIRDAEYRGLPLVGGGSEDAHDWGNILTMLDAVDSCYALARISFTLGMLVMLAGFLWGGYILYWQYRAMRQ